MRRPIRDVEVIDQRLRVLGLEVDDAGGADERGHRRVQRGGVSLLAASGTSHSVEYGDDKMAIGTGPTGLTIHSERVIND